MGIYRTYFDKNNTIVKDSLVNTGRNQVSELFFGAKKSRFLFYFVAKNDIVLSQHKQSPDLCFMFLVGDFLYF